jgi:ABC-type bacteriocin/lantibiotic exporter with double-glycine peptidase domain
MSEYPTETISTISTVNNTNLFNVLSMKGISYRYQDAKQNTLHQLSLDVHAGNSIGLIGASGSGKTTLVDILLGLLEPQQGEITFNGKPLTETLKDWRSNVAYIPQEIFLIDNTLRRNVALGIEDECIDEQRIINALRKARLSELIQKMPDGLDTILGERGIRLSGGQRQRVALARAFYHERDVLVMDEATSALDYETEHEIIEEIKRLKGDKTIIIIAHRLTTVKHCDRIYKLEGGRIVETILPSTIL